jgi:hypothetical protein
VLLFRTGYRPARPEDVAIYFMFEGNNWPFALEVNDIHIESVPGEARKRSRAVPREAHASCSAGMAVSQSLATQGSRSPRGRFLMQAHGHCLTPKPPSHVC